jgi:hypothetical protein
LNIRRHVFEKLRDTAPQLQAAAIPAYDKPGRQLSDFFRLENGEGEDVSFCRNARAAGFEIHALIGAKVKHLGMHTWEDAFEPELATEAPAEPAGRVLSKRSLMRLAG